MKKTIKDYNLRGKRVIIRVDFNVPIKDGIITDDTRIVESLETINYAIENGAKVILMSHLGRIKEKSDLEKNSLKAVSERLSELLNKKVYFSTVTRGEELENLVSNLKNGEVLLMENTRYEDLDDKKESSNDIELGLYWSSLGDIFINDAFGTSHRAHASNVGIASNLPNGIGFLIEKELKILGSAINNPKRPFAVILGGAKVSDKIGVIDNLSKTADYILIGGGMAFTFFKSMGYEIGKSILDEESIDFCKNILVEYPEKIILPSDVFVTEEIESNSGKLTSIDNITSNQIGVDIGPETIELFKSYLDKCQTIIWNGPVGMFEYDSYEYGTKSLCNYLATSKATTIIGGGDSGAAINKFELKNQVTHVSTGGGASLELLEGKKLPGIEVIEDL